MGDTELEDTEFQGWGAINGGKRTVMLATRIVLVAA